MENTYLGIVEQRFADLIWQNEPISSGDLVKLCLKELDWKKSTTYTVLRKLCLRGLFQNKDGCVTSLISRQEYDSLKSRHFVDEAFDGSLPAFLAAFASGKALSPKEVDQIQRLIDTCKEE